MHRKFNQFWYPILLRLPFEHFIIRHEFLYASLTFTSSTTKKSIFVHWKWMPIIQFKIKLYFFSSYRESYQFLTGKVVSMIFLGMNKLLNRKCFWQVVCCCCFMPFFFHYFFSSISAVFSQMTFSRKQANISVASQTVSA